jgi:RNA polymerase sigma-70 factor (family 1)
MQFEDDIFNKFNNNEADAFSKIYKELFPTVYYYAKRFVSYEEAQDISADVFLKLWKMKKNFRNIQSIKNYLQISVKHSCINFKIHLKVVHHHEHIFISSTDFHDRKLNEHDDIKAKQLTMIFTEIEKLPKQRKKVFELFYFGRLKEKEIAAKMNISYSTAHNQKQFALKKLRAALSNLFF